MYWCLMWVHIQMDIFHCFGVFSTVVLCVNILLFNMIHWCLIVKLCGTLSICSGQLTLFILNWHGSGYAMLTSPPMSQNWDWSMYSLWCLAIIYYHEKIARFIYWTTLNNRYLFYSVTNLSVNFNVGLSLDHYIDAWQGEQEQCFKYILKI